MSRPLTPSERTAYDHVSHSTLERARIRTLPWLPGTFLGITLGSSIFVTTDEPHDGTSSLIAHELVHVEQYRDQGWVGFLARYLADFAQGLWTERHWMKAYRGVSAEVDARRKTQHWALQRRS